MTSPSDRKLAYALLDQIIADCTRQRDPRRRRRAIREIRDWIKDDATQARFFPGTAGFCYTFSFWTDCLGVDEGYMARSLYARLSEWEGHLREQL